MSLRWHYPNQVMGLEKYLLSATSSVAPLHISSYNNYRVKLEKSQYKGTQGVGLMVY